MEAEKPVEEVLDDIAREEIVEVDIIMEDISEEIEDLQQSMNGSSPSTHRPPDLQCRMNDQMEVNCSSEIYNSRSDWRHSRSFINEQIRRLRAQLLELKEIRRHLKQKRPFKRKQKNREEKGEEDLAPIPENAVRCRCNDKY